jgi:hypothetical protein
MNITLSADKKLIEKARAYARKNNTSLNNLVREYLNNLVNYADVDSAADEFERNATRFSGVSEPGFRFNREKIYARD